MKIKIIFSFRATTRLEEIARHIYNETKSKIITRNYLTKLRSFITSTLSIFPQAGRVSDEIYENSRKIVYQGYSIIYRYNKDNYRIDILTIYRENLP